MTSALPRIPTTQKGRNQHLVTPFFKIQAGSVNPTYRLSYYLITFLPSMITMPL